MSNLNTFYQEVLKESDAKSNQVWYYSVAMLVDAVPTAASVRRICRDGIRREVKGTEAEGPEKCIILESWGLLHRTM